MAILHTGAGKFREINDDDYRAYLITRNQEPIVYHSQDIQLKRLQVHVRNALNRIDRLLRWMSGAISKSAKRKLWRELVTMGVYQHDATCDRKDSSSRNDCRHSSR